MFTQATATVTLFHSWRGAAVALALLSGSSAWAQQTSAADFVVDPADSSRIQYKGARAAVVGDDAVFQRCTFGMVWDAGSATCTGTPRSFPSMADAQAAVDQFNASFNPPLTSSKSWRIANINELRLLVPAPVGAAPTTYAVFPNTPPDFFWSSTKFAVSITTDIGNFVLNFADGSTSSSSGGNKYIRLITGYWPNDSFDYQVVPTDHSLVVDVGTVNIGTFYQRCTLGMAWDNDQKACLGTATVFADKNAVTAAVNSANTGSGVSDIKTWRLPGHNELTAMQPGTDYPPKSAPYILPIFSNTPSGQFYSNGFTVDFSQPRGSSVVMSGAQPRYARLVSGGPDVITFTVNAGAHGSVDQNSQLAIPPGFMTFNALPDAGYQVASASGDKCHVVPNVLFKNRYEIIAAPSSCVVSVTFERDPNISFLTAITAPADGSGGTLSCPAVASNGSPAQCKAQPAAGYRTQSIQGCQGAATGEGVDAFTTGTIAGDCTVTASFAPTYLFHISTPSNGSVTCLKTADNNPVIDGDVMMQGTAVTCEATTDPGYVFTGWAGDCTTISNGNVCTIASIQKDTTVTAQFVQAVKSFTGTTQPAQGPGGSATASFTGGGAACRFDTSGSETGFVPAPGTSPAGKTLPQGMFRFKLIGCDNTPVTVHIDWPEPVDGLIKYGLAAQGDSGSTFFLPNGVQVSGHTTQFVVTDGQKGDDDWTENGEIVDPVAAVTNAAPQPVSHPVPTLGQAALLALGLLAGLSGMAALRRQRT